MVKDCGWIDGMINTLRKAGSDAVKKRPYRMGIALRKALELTILCAKIR